MRPGKRIKVAFFCSENGTEPGRNWLKELLPGDRKAIGIDIKAVEFGWPIGMPVCRPLGEGLYEVRTSLKDRIARVLFLIDGNRMILLHGFIKKSQKTPDTELNVARERLRVWKKG